MVAKTKTSKATQLTHEQISRRAFIIYQKEGCPEGRALEHWQTAEAQLRAEVARRPRSTARASRASLGLYNDDSYSDTLQ